MLIKNPAGKQWVEELNMFCDIGLWKAIDNFGKKCLGGWQRCVFIEKV